MTFKPLDTVVLVRDFPDHGLRRGDLAAVVDTYDPAKQATFAPFRTGT